VAADALLQPARRAFLRGRAAAPARPPWARPEPDFLAACTRCDACVAACPEQVLIRGDGGYPELQFSAGECTFCAACLDACPTAALDANGHRPWRWRAAVGAGCLVAAGVLCRSCGDACPTAAIRFDPRAAVAPDVDATGCTGCGACVGVCPAEAMQLHEAAAA
jgi:ferredoxin-type protein NapF